ncbi:hypothetical protein [Rhodobacter capsulatus]|uniref:hypothetical protein n=1 Tax=Rhodobacter capsulatus TaxID=1061 RepID=UPI0040293858
MTPYAGQSDTEIAAWFRWKYPKGKTDKSSGAYAAALYKSRPGRGDPTAENDWYTRLTEAQRAILDDAKRTKGAAADEKKRIEFRDKYKLSDEESRKYWALRDLPPVGGKRVEWDRARDMLRRRKSAKPRQNEDLSKMTPAEREKHRRKQKTEAKQRERARKKAEEAAAASAPQPPPLHQLRSRRATKSPRCLQFSKRPRPPRSPLSVKKWPSNAGSKPPDPRHNQQARGRGENLARFLALFTFPTERIRPAGL